MFMDQKILFDQDEEFTAVLRKNSKYVHKLYVRMVDTFNKAHRNETMRLSEIKSRNIILKWFSLLFSSNHMLDPSLGSGPSRYSLGLIMTEVKGTLKSL